VVEEAPSSILTPEKRRAMGAAAVNVAQACGYCNAGTVEFILDDQLNFYFLEMNTRLQVEHPVTEQITGLDLVRLQIQVAQGEPLPFAQEDLRIHGHAIEVRVYAEDPTNNFLPDIGNLKTYVRPNGPGIRVDDGFEQGMDVPFYYDPMIAKLVCHAADREAAIARTIRAIDEYEVTGVQTTLGFCRFVMTHPAFTSGQFDTRFVEQHFSPAALQPNQEQHVAELASLLAASVLSAGKQVEQTSSDLTPGRWRHVR
jgi:propionyl-CoA carboxylase alpha chain